MESSIFDNVAAENSTKGQQMSPSQYLSGSSFYSGQRHMVEVLAIN